MTNKLSLLIVSVLLFTAFTANSQNWSELIKVCASDREANDNYSFSVAIDGDYAIVGAYQEDEDTLNEATLSNAGSAYIYKNEAGTWVEMQKIVASDRSSIDNFGYSVAINGDYVIVGAYQEDNDVVGGNTMSNSGSAYIFKNIAGEWTEMQKIVASDRNTDDFFGASVSISGEYAVIGAYQEDENASGNSTMSNSGSAYIFHNVSDTWSEVQKIVASDRSAVDYFGLSVSMSGDYLIVGAYSEDENVAGSATLNNAGSAYIFKNNAGTWAQSQKIVASDRGAEDFFGYSVSISGNVAIVGAYQEDHNTSGSANLANSGSAYIYTRNGSTWTQSQKLVASDRDEGDQFGYAVSICGDYAIVGSSLEDEDISGENSFFNAGSAYIYKNVAGSWSQAQKIVPSDRANSDLFGTSVAIGNYYTICGAYQEDHDAIGGSALANPGSAYIFVNGHEIAVKQNTTSIADASTFSFGSFLLGENSGAVVFTIQNQGGAPLSLNGSPVVVLSGVNSSDFTLDQTEILSSLLPGESTSFTITFTASVVGLKTADISIANNDTDENPFNFTITGNGSTDLSSINSNESNISVYPNPTAGLVNFDFNDVLIKNIQLTDLCGKIIFEKSDVLVEETIDFSYLANGVYFVVMQTENQSYSLKLIKE